MTTATQQISQNIVNAAALAHAHRRQGGRELRRPLHRRRESGHAHRDRHCAARDRRRRRRGCSRRSRRHSRQWKRVTPKIAAGCCCASPTSSEAETESIARTVALETGNAIRTQATPRGRRARPRSSGITAVSRARRKERRFRSASTCLSYTRREPIGVVGGIVPWNAPVVLGTLKIAMAIAAGNTLVLKAAEDAPLGLAARRAALQRAPAAGRAEPADRLRRGNAARRSRGIRSCASCRSPDRRKSAS